MKNLTKFKMQTPMFATRIIKSDFNEDTVTEYLSFDAIPEKTVENFKREFNSFLKYLFDFVENLSDITMQIVESNIVLSCGLQKNGDLDEINRVQKEIQRNFPKVLLYFHSKYFEHNKRFYEVSLNPQLFFLLI